MKSKIFILSLAALSLMLVGCGKKEGPVGVVGQIQSAQEFNKNLDNAKEIATEENIENLLKGINYQGVGEEREKMKMAVKSGMEDGKKQGELNKEIAKDGKVGSGYLLGYVFGCGAVTGDKDKCNEDMGTKYQAVMLEELNKQYQGMMPAGQ